MAPQREQSADRGVFVNTSNISDGAFGEKLVSDCDSRLAGVLSGVLLLSSLHCDLAPRLLSAAVFRELRASANKRARLLIQGPNTSENQKERGFLFLLEPQIKERDTA